MTKANRIDALKANGIDTNGMLSLSLGNGMTLNINVTDDDAVANQIKVNGTVNNEKLYRRWVCAQMLRIMDDMKKYNRYNFDSYMNGHYKYTYMFDMMEDEYKVLDRMKRDGDSALEMRKLFFNPERVASAYSKIAHDIMDAMIIRTQASRLHTCKKRPYIKIGTEMVFVDDVKKRTRRMFEIVDEMVRLARYDGLYKEIRQNMIEFHKELPKGIDKDYLTIPHEFVDMYKAAGSYYTLQNLFLFHDAKVTDLNQSHWSYAPYGIRNKFIRVDISGDDAYKYLNEIANKHANEGYYLFGMLKDVVELNNISIKNLY